MSRHRKKGVTMVLYILPILLLLCTVAVGVSWLQNRRLPTASVTPERLSTHQKAILTEVIHLRRVLGDTVWPNWGQADIPLIVYNEAYAFLVAYPDPPDGWLKVPANTLRGGPWELVPDDDFGGSPYYRQRLQAGVTPEAYTVLVGERWVASLGTQEWMQIALVDQFRQDLPPFVREIFPYRLATRMLLRGTDGYVCGILHEAFHAYQGIEAAERLAVAERAVRWADAYPHSETAMQEAWQVELDLLAQALRAPADDTDRIAALARQFLGQREQRRQSLAPALIDYERQREWAEGLARYAELGIWRAGMQAEAYQPSPGLATDRDFGAYGGYNRRWSQEIDQMRRTAGSSGDGRFYYSGMAQAVLLDRLSPGWKDQAMAEGIFLEDLLSAALRP